MRVVLDTNALVSGIFFGGVPGLIVSGDKHLLKVSGWQEIEVMTPREFVNEHLAGAERPER